MTIKYDLSTTLGTDQNHYVEIPHDLDDLYVLGGSFRLKNTGTEADDFSVAVLGTSEKAEFGVAAKYHKLVQIALHPVQAGATVFHEFMVPDAPKYLGHTNYQIFIETADQPCEVSVNLVLKKA